MTRCAIWYHVYILKNVKNTHGGALLLLKSQASTFWQFVPNRATHHISKFSVTTSYPSEMWKKYFVGIYHFQQRVLYELFLAHNSNEWCHSMVRTGSTVLISLYCVLFPPFSFFFSYFLLSLLLLKYRGKFFSSYNKVVELFTGLTLEVGCFSLI